MTASVFRHRSISDRTSASASASSAFASCALASAKRHAYDIQRSADVGSRRTSLGGEAQRGIDGPVDSRRFGGQSLEKYLPDQVTTFPRLLQGRRDDVRSRRRVALHQSDASSRERPDGVQREALIELEKARPRGLEQASRSQELASVRFRVGERGEEVAMTPPRGVDRGETSLAERDDLRERQRPFEQGLDERRILEPT